jgi:hypothetical protein
MLCAIGFMPNIIKTNNITQIETCTQNMKDEIAKLHLKNNPQPPPKPLSKKIGTKFTLNLAPTTNKPLQKMMF